MKTRKKTSNAQRPTSNAERLRRADNNRIAFAATNNWQHYVWPRVLRGAEQCGDFVMAAVLRGWLLRIPALEDRK